MAEDDDTQQNPFTRPGFIIGAVVVAALIVTAIVAVVLLWNEIVGWTLVEGQRHDAEHPRAAK